MLEPSSSATALHAPLLAADVHQPFCRLPVILTAITGGLVFAAIISVRSCLPTADIFTPLSDLLIFGANGASWANGTVAITTSGSISWACGLSDGALALLEEDTSALYHWHPQRQHRRKLFLPRLRAPVQCEQSGPWLYVACFGIEEDPGRSGIAIIDLSTWMVAHEQTFPGTTHVHHVYPTPGPPGGNTSKLFFMDVGDPWIQPSILGGVFEVLMEQDRATYDPMMARRIGPRMHARAAIFPTAGAGEAPSTAYVITQQPSGEATQVVSLVGDGWMSDSPTQVSAVARMALPRPSWPSDGGADIFRLGARLFATDRYGGNGALYELVGADVEPDKMQVIGSVELGQHPRFTDALGSSDTIFSVSRLDGLLTVVDARRDQLQVIARLPAGVSLPSFLLRWGGGTTLKVSAFGFNESVK